MAYLRRAAASAACCSTLAAAGAHITSFVKWPEYTGSLTIEGQAIVGQANGKDTVLWYFINGGDSLCTGTDNGKTDSCGVIMHEGTTCTVAGLGKHHHLTTEDPWGAVKYAVSDGEAAAANVVVQAGLQLAEMQRTLVIYDSEGAKVACGVFKLDPVTAGTSPAYASSFAKYPGYTGSLAVEGLVTVTQTADVVTPADPAVVLTYELEGADPRCLTSASRTKANACGIHVHAGACSDAGGHYYAGEEDEWVRVVYFADATGKTGACVSQMVSANVTVASTVGRSMVVHDLDGVRVGCADISLTKPSTKASIVSGAWGRATGGAMLAALLALTAGLL